MRATWFFVIVFCGCAEAVVSQSSPQSLRERLATETALVVSPDSTGGISAERKTRNGWEAGFVELGLESGRVSVVAEPSGALIVGALDLAIAPIEIPSSLIGRRATLVDVHLELVAATRMPATWLDDREGRASAPLQLELSWALAIDGVTSPIGSPRLPALPVEVRLEGGEAIDAEVRIELAGEVWSWADLLRLVDLNLLLVASS